MATTYEHLDDLYVNQTVITLGQDRLTITDPDCTTCIGVMWLANVAAPGVKPFEVHVPADATITTVEG